MKRNICWGFVSLAVLGVVWMGRSYAPEHRDSQELRRIAYYRLHDAIQRLAGFGVAVAADAAGNNALHLYFSSPNQVHAVEGVVRQLLEAGADPMARNREGLTPGELAERRGEIEMLLGALRALGRAEDAHAIESQFGIFEDPSLDLGREGVPVGAMPAPPPLAPAVPICERDVVAQYGAWLDGRLAAYHEAYGQYPMGAQRYRAILGAGPHEDQRAIRRAHRRIIMQYHPDRYRGDLPEPVVMLIVQRINDALDRLRGPEPWGAHPYAAPGGPPQTRFDAIEGLAREWIAMRAYGMMRDDRQQGSNRQRAQAILGLEANFSAEDLDEAFRRMMGEYDPEVADIERYGDEWHRRVLIQRAIADARDYLQTQLW